MPAIDDLFTRAGLGRGDLDAVVADVGPGLFTGLRVGISTAAALAAAQGLRAAGVTSLQSLAYAQRRWRGMVAPAVDARRGELYWALYQADGVSVEELRPPEVAAPEEVAAQLGKVARAGDGGGQLLVCGDGAWRYREVLGRAGASIAGPADMWPSPLVVAELGAQRLATGTELGLHPLYLRQADVRIGWEQVGGRVGGPQPPVAPGAGDAVRAHSRGSSG